MGLAIEVTRPEGPCRVGLLLEKLAGAGLPSTVMMVDGGLVMPGTEPHDGWRDVRLRTPAGTVTLARRPGPPSPSGQRDRGGFTTVAVTVFGNAEAALQAAQATIAEVLRALP